MRRDGRRKVLFGTNHPMIPAAKALEGIDDLGLDDEARSLFLGENAQRVFGLPDLAGRALGTP
jgi:predicted TIM-barrel fold metal-dependent hydrolase